MARWCHDSTCVTVYLRKLRASYALRVVWNLIGRIRVALFTDPERARILRKLRRAIQDNDFPSSKNSVSEYPYFEFQHRVWKWLLDELHATRYLNILFQHDDLLSCCELDISTFCWKRWHVKLQATWHLNILLQNDDMLSCRHRYLFIN